MEHFSAHKLFSRLGKNEFFLAYRGVFTDDLTDKLLLLSDKNVSSVEALKASKKRISFLLVESFQNILKYGDVGHNSSTDQKGMFILRLVENTFYITSVNRVHKNNVQELTRNLDLINASTKEDLKQTYVNRLDDSSYKTEKGAGLGWIEMARKSDNKLDYYFEETEEPKVVFYLTIRFGAEVPVDSHLYAFNKLIYEYFISNEVIMTFKTTFSQEKIQPMWKIMQDNLTAFGSKRVVNKKRFLILVALTQNIAKHASNKGMGILQVRMNEGNLIFQAGNYVNEKNLVFLEKRLNVLKNLSLKEVHAQYLKHLRSQISDEVPGFALYEVYKYAEHVHYHFTKDKEATYYQIDATI